MSCDCELGDAAAEDGMRVIPNLRDGVGWLSVVAAGQECVFDWSATVSIASAWVALSPCVSGALLRECCGGQDTPKEGGGLFKRLIAGVDNVGRVHVAEVAWVAGPGVARFFFAA